MIVKMCITPEYERMVECDTVHKTIARDLIELSLYKNGKLIESPKFTDSVQIFFMENGKTIDRIDFQGK